MLSAWYYTGTCVFKSCLDTAECWKMHVMSQVTLQSSLSLLFDELPQQVCTMHAVCLILYRDVCLQVLSWHSRVLEDACHVPSDLAVKSLLAVWWANPTSIHHACCLPDTIPGRVSSSPVLTQQNAGRCMSCTKRPCSQVSPCWALSKQTIQRCVIML